MSYTVKRRVHNYFYLYEVEAYWNKTKQQSRQRTIRCLGRCDEKGRLTVPASVRVDSVHTVCPVGGLSLFYAAARQLDLVNVFCRSLGVSRREASLLLTICLNQLVGRQPLDRLAKWMHLTPLSRWEGIDAQHLDRGDFESMLGRLCSMTPAGVIEEPGLGLQETLTHVWRGKSREPAAYYYDITKQHYYGNECPYAGTGLDADHGISNVVGFGMVTSKLNHHPVLCRPLPGHANDTTTVRETVFMLDAFKLRGLTLVMDRGMISKENIDIAADAGYSQVGIVRGWPKGSWEYAGRWAGALHGPEHAIRRASGDAVYGRAFTGTLYGRRMRVAVIEDPLRAAEEERGRDAAISELLGHVGDERAAELREELKRVIVTGRGRRGFTVNADAVAEEAKRDGRFLLFGTDTGLSAKEMFDLYFERDSIEKAFRTVKGDLSLGPIRYRRRDRLLAYSTVVYTSYLLWSWSARTLKNKIAGMTVERALSTLDGVGWVRFGHNKSVHEWVSQLTDEQSGILHSIGAEEFLPRI